MHAAVSVALPALTSMGDATLIGSGNAKAKWREPKSCLGRVFNFELGCFVVYPIARHIQAPLSLDLKTRPKFHPVTRSLSRIGLILFIVAAQGAKSGRVTVAAVSGRFVATLCQCIYRFSRPRRNTKKPKIKIFFHFFRTQHLRWRQVLVLPSMELPSPALLPRRLFIQMPRDQNRRPHLHPLPRQGQNRRPKRHIRRRSRRHPLHPWCQISRRQGPPWGLRVLTRFNSLLVFAHHQLWPVL